MSKKITANLPITIFKQNQENAENYRIYGTAEGAGIKTEQLFDKNANDTDNGFVARKYILKSGNLTANSNYNVSEYIPIQADIQYCLYWAYTASTQPAVVFYDSDKQYLSGKTYGSNSSYVFTPEVDGYLRCSYRINLASEISLTEGSEPTTELIYGHKLPLTLTSGMNTDTYPLYIGNTKLSAEEYLDYAEQKVYKRNPASFLWFQVFAYPQSDKRFLYSIAWTEADRPNLQGDVGFVALRGQEQIITHETEGVTAINIDQERISDYLYSSGMIRDLGEGCNFRTFVKIGDEYFYGENLHITYNEIVAAPDEEILLDRPAVVLPHDLPAPLPAITVYQGENTLSSTKSVGSVSLEFNEATFYAGNNITQVYTNNQLYDLIDSSFYSLIANSYDSTQTYETDSYCIYNYCLYKCITTITVPEAFNPIKWQQITLADFIQGGA